MSSDQDWQSGKSLAECNKLMFEKEIDTDVTFMFPGSGKNVKAHKLILKSRSRAFFVMFSSGLQEAGKVVEISDIKPDVFKDLLKFLYCGEVDISAENAFRLLYAAQKYQVDSLRTRCAAYLQNTLSVETVGRILDQAVFYDDARLIAECLQLLTDNPAQSVERLNDTHLARDTLQLVVGLEKLAIDDLRLFETCNDWAHVECKQRGIPVTGDNKREVLGSVLQKISYSGMTSEDIVSKVSPSGLLTLQQEVDLFRSRNAPGQKKCTEQPSEVCVMFPANFSTSKRSKGSFLAVIESDKVVTVKGFVFANTGTYRLKLEAEGCARSEHVKFNVYEEGAKLYLPNPYSFWEGKLSIEEDTYAAYGLLLGVRYCVHVFKQASVCHKRPAARWWPCGVWCDTGGGYSRPEATLRVTRTEGVPIGGVILSVL